MYHLLCFYMVCKLGAHTNYKCIVIYLLIKSLAHIFSGSKVNLEFIFICLNYILDRGKSHLDKKTYPVYFQEKKHPLIVKISASICLLE